MVRERLDEMTPARAGPFRESQRQNYYFAVYCSAHGGCSAVYKVSVERVNADGSLQKYRYSAKYDGKDYPITGQGPNGADTIAIKRIDANTVEATAKKASKVLFTTKAVVSTDVSVMTFTSKGTDASGQRFNNVVVYDKLIFHSGVGMMQNRGQMEAAGTFKIH
jgi:hypothetical protein